MVTRRIRLIGGLSTLLILTLLAVAPVIASNLGHPDVYVNEAVQAQDGSSPRVSSELLIAGVVVALAIAIRLAVFLGGRGRGGGVANAQQGYGPAGGAICPKCGRPFARNLLSPNLLAGKLSRCPHCGKWSVVSRATPAALAAVEAASSASTPSPAADLSPEEKLRRQIDESRYER